MLWTSKQYRLVIIIPAAIFYWFVVLISVCTHYISNPLCPELMRSGSAKTKALWPTIYYATMIELEMQFYAQRVSCIVPPQPSHPRRKRIWIIAYFAQNANAYTLCERLACTILMPHAISEYTSSVTTAQHETRRDSTAINASTTLDAGYNGRECLCILCVGYHPNLPSTHELSKRMHTYSCGHCVMTGSAWAARAFDGAVCLHLLSLSLCLLPGTWFPSGNRIPQLPSASAPSAKHEQWIIKSSASFARGHQTHIL